MNTACSPMASCALPPTSTSLSSSNSLFFSGQSQKRLGLVSARWRRSPFASRGRGALGCRCLFGLGVPELAVIVGVTTLVFGPKKLPEVGKIIGKTLKSFQQAAKEFETELKKETEVPDDPPPPVESLRAASHEDEKKDLNSSGLNERMKFFLRGSPISL